MTHTKITNEIKQVVAAYFNGTQYYLEVHTYGKLADLTIHYTDFKPTRQVRRDLEDLIPNLDQCTLVRSYSPEVMAEAIDLVGYTCKDIYIKNEQSGEYEQTTLPILLEQELFGRSFGKQSQQK